MSIVSSISAPLWNGQEKFKFNIQLLEYKAVNNRHFPW